MCNKNRAAEGYRRVTESRCESRWVTICKDPPIVLGIMSTRRKTIHPKAQTQVSYKGPWLAPGAAERYDSGNVGWWGAHQWILEPEWDKSQMAVRWVFANGFCFAQEH
jgi:hypothetical protein